MIVRLFEAAKIGAKCKVSYDVKGGEIEPGSHISWSAVLGKLLKSFHEEANILAEDGLLVAHRALGEAVGQLTSQESVVFAVRGHDAVGYVLAHDAVEPVVLGHLVGAMVSVDVLPCLRVDEGQLERRDADYGPILVVETLDGLR